MSKKWLITGGCGFIGRNLIDSIINGSDDTIVILDNLSVGTEDDLAVVCSYKKVTKIEDSAERVQLVVGDILDSPLVREISKGIDVIVHLAANTGVPKSVENPVLDFELNAHGTFLMLEAARHAGVGRFVFASSGAPAGRCEPPITETSAPSPISPYGASKLAGEGYCSAYFGSYGVETVSLRFGNVYGPLSTHKTSVVAKFINLALQGQAWEIYGDGSQTRDFIYIGDLIDSILAAAKTPGVGGEVFQIASGGELTVLEMASELKRILSNSGVDSVEIKHTAPRIGDALRNYSDTSKAKAMLGWEVNVPLVEGLEKTIKWFLNNK